MKHEEVVHTESLGGPAMAKRISWGAVFAGLIVALVVQLVLTLLGVAVGAATIEPFSQQTSAKGVATGAAIWLLVSGLIALFVAGCVAGRLAGAYHRSDGGLHGFITWGLATLVTFLLLTTAVGGLIGGVSSTLGRVFAGAMQNPQVAQQLNLQNVREQARVLLPQTGPTSSQAKQAADEFQRTHGTAAQDPQAASRDLTAALERMFKNASGGQVNPSDRQEVMNILVSRYNMNQDEANRAVSQWEQTAQSSARGAAGPTREEVRETGQKVAHGASQAALWSFIALILGAAAAYLGGLVGTPREILTTGTTTEVKAPA